MRNNLAILLGLMIIVFSFFDLMNRPIICRMPARLLLTLATVEYGNFSETIPVTGVTTVDSISKVVSVITEIDKYFLSCVAPGQKAVTVIDHRDYSLTLSSVDSAQTEGRFKAVLLFDDEVQPSLLRDPVRLRLHLSEPTDAIQIPVGGFYKDAGGSFIYVVRNDTIVKRNIMLGRKNSDYFEVLAGLHPGEKVIISSYDGFDLKEDTLSLSKLRDLYE